MLNRAASYQIVIHLKVSEPSKAALLSWDQLVLRIPVGFAGKRTILVGAAPYMWGLSVPCSCARARVTRGLWQRTGRCGAFLPRSRLLDPDVCHGHQRLGTAGGAPVDELPSEESHVVESRGMCLMFGFSSESLCHKPAQADALRKAWLCGYTRNATGDLTWVHLHPGSRATRCSVWWFQIL